MNSKREGLTLGTFNINGASNYEKLKDTFDYIRRKDIDIILLQETHWKTESENYIRSIWGYNCFICGNSNASKGVAIVFKNTFTYKINRVIRDMEGGSYIVLDLSIFDERYIIVNIYGPSERDTPDFFTNIFQKIEDTGCRQVMIGGDWNVVLNPNIDTRNYRGFNTRQRSRQIIKQKMEFLDLVDIYRKVFPDKKAYTWRRFNTTQQSRLDYILISDNLVDKVTNAEINSGYRSDHSIPCITFKNLHMQKKIRGYWKFNNSLLKDRDYVSDIRSVILNTKKQYCVPIYDHNNIENVSDEDIQLTINDQLFFEMLLLEIRAKTISFASHKKKVKDREELTLIRDIEALENIPNLDHNSMLLLEEKRLQLQELRDQKLKGIIIRSRINWLQHGEKPSKYFSRLESRNFVAKRMAFLQREDGSIIYEQDELLEETKQFYKKLYDKRQVNSIDLDVLVNYQKKLSDIQRESIEGLISFKEAADALRNMKDNKSPGNSGFTTEFYKFFFQNIGHFLVRSINYGFSINQLSISQRQGIITCLPKEGKNLQQLNNWRPISLLNVAYKIASTCISNRIKGTLEHLISEQQTGFQSGKFIGSNLNLMYNILSYTESEQIPGMLVLVDFYKAFDTIAWSFIEQVLDFLNFGDDIKRWVRLFYTEISSCVIVNGKYSEYFKICRGVRQGDPLSPYLFLLCAELLAQILRENDQIKGLKIKNEKAFLSQFADDTALYLDGSKESFENCIRTLNLFASLSGLTINFNKTIIVWLGSKKNSNERYLRDMNFTWDPGGAENSKFKYLGVYFSTNIKNIVKLNYENKTEEIIKILNTWSKRSLTPFGKITVIKMLALSKLTYVFMNLPDPERKFLKELETLFLKFLWNGKVNRICKNYCFLRKLDGGIDMVNIFDYVSYLKISMFKKLLCNSEIKILLYTMHPCIENIEHFGYDYIDKMKMEILNDFWKDVIMHVKTLLIKKKPDNFQDFLCEHIFYNPNIQVDNKNLFLRVWYQNGITKIHHLVKDDSFFNYIEFCLKYPNVNTNFLVYNGVISAIRRYARNLNLSHERAEDLQDPVGWRILRNSKMVIKDTLRLDVHLENHKSIKKWNDKFDNLNWTKIFRICNKSTIDTKLRWFQYRLIYRILPTNRFLHVRRLKNNELCELCNIHVETIEHMLYECPSVLLFWQNLFQKFVQKLPHVTQLRPSKELILFGVKEGTVTDKPIDLFFLLAKFYVYGCRFTHSVPNADIFIKRFEYRYIIEKRYNENVKNPNFTAMWLPYLHLMNV